MMLWKTTPPRPSRSIDASVICMFAMLPGLFWTSGPETAKALRTAGIEQFAAPPEQLGAWNQAGFHATALGDRVKLITPGIDRKVQVASATTAPWVNSNGWRLRREPDHQFLYDLPAQAGGAVPLAAAEAFAFNANAMLKIDPASLDAFSKMLQFLRTVPERTLPDVADFGFVDDGSDMAGEQLNLLARRNLLFRVLRAPDPKLRLNIKTNSDDPHLFAAKVREQLKDDQRTLRVYGSEVVLCRLAGDASLMRIHVLNYGRNNLEGVRLRIRGSYASGKLYGQLASPPLADFSVADGFTEFSIPHLGAYAVVDLTR